ncbi:MAG: ATP-binding protein [Kiritimatiellae bacterium]|nr:ATP-binding protein [Kiritimatiellia bacterium]
MYIERGMAETLPVVMGEYPIVTLSGPRQSGKTTLTKKSLPKYRYVNMEDADSAEFARSDPKGFLRQYPAPLVIDEAQRVPELMSSLQVAVDERRDMMGQYVLTGSHQPLLREKVSQSLAGRTAVLDLFPLSLAELGPIAIGMDADEIMFRGFMPEIYRRSVSPARYYRNYLNTYVERDVRMMVNIRNLSMFEKFLRLLAGRIGQLVNLSQLSVEVGVSSTTLNEWLSILEASYIVYRLSPYYGNFSKRLVKTAKIYFTDVGLATHLLGISSVTQLGRDPLRGNLFENLVIMDAVKHFKNSDGDAQFYFIRTQTGFEIDLLIEAGGRLRPVEIKSATTCRDALAANVRRFAAEVEQVEDPTLVYDGEDYPERLGVKWVNFRRFMPFRN